MGKYFTRTVIMNRTMPGSGKTLLSCCITDAILAAELTISSHSTDDFFMGDERYCFDPTELSDYPYWNLLDFQQSLRRSVDAVVCDNMNLLQTWQPLPYAELTRRHGYQIIFMNLTLHELRKHVAAHQVTPEKTDTHGIPEARLVDFIRDFNKYDESLNPAAVINPAEHHHYVGNQRKVRPEVSGSASHFDLDLLVTIRPDEYHEAKKLTGADFLALIREKM